MLPGIPPREDLSLLAAKSFFLKGEALGGG